MRKNKTYLIIVLIFSLIFFSANLVYPKYFNLGVDFLSQKLSWSLPHFWEKPYSLRYDLGGGALFSYEFNFSEEDESSILQGLKDIIENRIRDIGTEKFSIKTKKATGYYQLTVELIGEDEDIVESIPKIIEISPSLSFREQRSEEETEKIIQKQREAQGKNFEELQKMEEWYLAFEDPFFKATNLREEHVKEIEVLLDQNSLRPIISLQFNQEGAEIFKDLSSKNIDKLLAIYVDQSLILSFSVEEEISGDKIQISGNFTHKQAERITGSLAAATSFNSSKLVSQKVITQEDNIRTQKNIFQAVLIVFSSTVLFMIIIYRLAGVLGSIVLTIWLILIGALVKLIPLDLSIFSVAGFVFSIGIYAVSHTIIFFRIKEELEEKKIFSEALEQGFRKSQLSTRNIYLTTLIASSFLFLVELDPISDFVKALGLGILVTVLCTLITKIFLRYFKGTKAEQWVWLWK